MHKKKQQEVFTPNLNSNKTIDIVENFLNGDIGTPRFTKFFSHPLLQSPMPCQFNLLTHSLIGKGLVSSGQHSQASMYDEYTKYKYKQPASKTGYFMRDFEHEANVVHHKAIDESVKHVAYLLGAQLNGFIPTHSLTH